MFNPFAPFERKFLDGFKKKGVRVFVKQTYNRGRNMLEENPRPAFLLIHFNNEKKAAEHFDAIKADPNRRIYYIDDPKDWNELLEALSIVDGPRFYSLLTIPDVNRKARVALDKKIRAYIDFKADWKPKRSDEISFSLDIVFGEIYVLLTYGTREIRLKLDDFENVNYVL